MTPSTRAVPLGAARAAVCWRPWLELHLGFAVVAIAVLALPAPAHGLRVLALVVGYHAAAALLSRRDRTLRRTWAILGPFSLLMVLPDWFLADILGVLRFPDTGGPFVGSVPVAMAGMWTIALMPVVAAGLRWGVLAAAVAGLVVFGGAELLAPALQLWEPAGVTTVLGLAVYVLIPEVILSICAYLLVASPLPRRVTAWLTFLLPFTYLGLLASSYQFLG